MTIDRRPIFDAAKKLGAKFENAGDVAILDRAIDAALGILPHHALTDAAAFYDGVRRVTGALDTVQVDTINRILAGAAHWPLSWVAYGLATAWHEARFKPQPEWGKGKGRPYAKPGARMKAKSPTPVYDGQLPYGRGLVQLTWCDNYEWADNALGLNGELLKNFDLALNPDIASRILIKGMEDGAFTGRSLRTCLPDRIATEAQFIGCRPVINGHDKEVLIAGYAVKFQAALQVGGWAP